MITPNPVVYGHVQTFQDNYQLSFEYDNGIKSIFESSIVFYFEKLQKRNTFYFGNSSIQKEMEKNSEYLANFYSYYKSLDM